MRKLFGFTLILSFASWLSASGQSASPSITHTIHIKNQLTDGLVDASLEWDDKDAVRKLSTGKYQITLEPGAKGTLAITRDGYFDGSLPLDYDSARNSPLSELKLQPGIPQLNISILSGETEETITSAIDLFTMDESSIVFSEEVEISPYTIDLEYNKVHVLQVRSNGYFSFKDTIDYTNVYEGKVRTRTIHLVPLKTGNKISLNNIHFKQNEANLTDFAKLMLVELTHVLEQQKSIVIEIGAHTDDVGSDAYNLSLSGKRAQAVKNYLVEKGAKPQQLQTKGFGESVPVVANDSEENKGLNRRVEFKIISIQ